jgi:hypothetical protein
MHKLLSNYDKKIRTYRYVVISGPKVRSFPLGSEAKGNDFSPACDNVHLGGYKTVMKRTACFAGVLFFGAMGGVPTWFARPQNIGTRRCSNIKYNPSDNK